MACITYLVMLLFQLAIPSSFHPLSDAILRDEVVKYLPLEDIHQSVSRINRETYKAIGLELNYVHKIEAIISEFLLNRAIGSHQVQIISNLSQQLKLSELFILRRHSILTRITRTFPNMHIINPCVRSVYFAFNAHTITISEYQQLTFPDLTLEAAAKAKLLVLSSRVSAPIPISASSLNLSDILTTHQIQYRNDGKQSILSNFPWFYQNAYLADFSTFPGRFVHRISRRHYYFMFMFDFVFSHYHKELKIPSLDAIFRPGIDSVSVYKKEIQNLIQMIDKYRLFIHHPQIVHQNMEQILRDEIGHTPCVKQVFIRFVIGADLINTFIFDESDRSVVLKNDIMTAFILYLHDELSNNCDHMREHDYGFGNRSVAHYTARTILKELLKSHYRDGRTELVMSLADVLVFL
eukprot:457388_1